MEPLLLKLFLRTLDTCYSNETIKRSLDLLVAHGFRLVADTENVKYEHAVPEVSPTLQHDIDKYLAHRGEQLLVQAYSLGDSDLNFVLLLVPNEGLLACRVHWEDLPDAKNYLALLETVKDLYRIWRPFYGHQDYPDGISLSRNRVINVQNIDYLYEINLFGPELVNKLGRDRLLSAPVWKVEALDDGGIFLIPDEQVTVDGKRYSMKKAADYLGMKTPQAPGEEWDEYDEDDE